MANVGFLRYFTSDPGDDVLLAIEGVSIIDQTPPQQTAGSGTGVVCMVAELEDGAFNEPTEVVSGNDFLSNWGGFGYTYNGVQAQNPCARVRKADSAVIPEYWNGNGAVAVNGKVFFRLLVTRVDTSVGTVNLTRCASITGQAKFTYALTSGEHLDTVAAAPVVTTFTGAVASHTSSGATYAVNPGDWVKLSYDGGPTFQVNFLSGDDTQGGVIARINLYAGFAFAATATGQFSLTGRVAGLAGRVQVVAFSSGGVGTALGLTVATYNGSGNVQNIAKVTFGELQSLVETADPNITVEQLADGSPRMVNTGVPGTGTLEVATTTTALDFGFPLGVTDSAATGNAGTIPAGTLLSDGTHQWVTMQTIQVSSIVQTGNAMSGPGPYTVPIRHATDDGTGVGVMAGAIDEIVNPIQLDGFVVINLAPTTAALTENQLDNAYLTALDSTIDINSVASLTNIIFSARQSDAVRQGVKNNVITATAQGMSGRVGTVRPPLGTLAATAESLIAEPGVGATASDRVIYNYPGTSTRMAGIAQLGLSGGAGFTADGVIDVGSDSWCAAFMSILEPEENPGQDPSIIAPWMGNALGLESSPNAQNLQMQDYINMKAVGICGARYNGGTLFFQSGVTSVNPTLYPSLVNIARRRMADFLQDSIAVICEPFVKQLSKKSRRDALKNQIIAFYEGLLGRTNENLRRISGYTVNDSPTTPAMLSRGLYRIISNARTLASLDDIALMSTVGENVQVDVLAPGETQ
jgi:hypothetical protein